MSSLRELIHASIDGDISSRERAELDRQLAQDPAARALYDELCEVDSALQALPLIDIPTELKSSLREAAKQHHAPHVDVSTGIGLLVHFRQQIRKWQFNKRTSFMSTQGKHTIGRQKVWAVVGVLAIAIGVVGYLDLGSENSYLSGALQQADRYRDNNISSDDVVLGDDDVAQLLQSDAFMALIEDESFSQLMADAKFTNLMANREFRALMANRQAQQLMANRQFQNLMQNAKFTNLMANRQLQQLMADGRVQNLMANKSWAALMSNASYAQLMSNIGFQQLMANRNFQSLMANRSFSNLMSQGRVINLMANNRMANLMANGRMAALMANGRVVNAMQNARVNQARTTQ